MKIPRIERVISRISPVSGQKKSGVLGYTDTGMAVATLPWSASRPRTAPIGAFDLLTGSKRKAVLVEYRFSFGADTGIRTRDLVLTKDVLYLLSHISTRYVVII